MTHLSVIQHTQSEWLGSIEDHLEGRGIRFGYHRPFTVGGRLPDIATLGDGLVLVGGGPWGTRTAGNILPALDAEVRLVRACLMLEKPVLAFGLGAQILSLAAEGDAAPAALSLRIDRVIRGRDDALGGLMPAVFPMIVYMRDAPVPPAYADILARDDAGRAAVFAIGPKAFGFAGHIGMRRAMIEDLIMEGDDTPADPAPVLDAMPDAARDIEDALVPLMAGLLRACGW